MTPLDDYRRTPVWNGGARLKARRSLLTYLRRVWRIMLNVIGPNQSGFRMRLKFWGVRGSTPSPQIENMGYGGNTPCLEMRGPGPDVFIFDGGTGLRQLGDALLDEFKNKKLRIHFFSTHCHWDHIQGIPFFAPLYQADHEVIFYSFSAANDLQPALEYQMKGPFFPVNFDSVPIRRKFIRLESGPVKCDGLTILPFPVNHPQGAAGYRVEYAGASVVYASDLENGHPQLDTLLRDTARNADLLIHDSQYTPEEYEHRRGWGHITWLQAAEAAKDAKVKQLILFHHDPSHKDEFIAGVTRDARKHVENTEAAREGWVVSL